MTTKDKINQLIEKLNFISQRQDEFSKEINSLKIQIQELRNEYISRKKTEVQQDIEKKPELISKKTLTSNNNNTAQPINKTTVKPTKKSDLEKFIGENLINKIGIAIIIFGVAIGAKYSIENELISPLTRIILGYLTGLGLFAFAVKLKKKYDKFSAVLLSGSMTILYFITFFAYNFYEIIPQPIAFLLMFTITSFTVISAINYNRQIIAFIGLVGAYAVPFLLSNNSGNVTALFSYMTIINIGVLAVSIKKYWKALYYSSFGLTWLIFSFWTINDYTFKNYFIVAFGFATLFFIIFYTAFISYKIIKKEKFELVNISLLLSNAFIYFGLGILILNDSETTKDFAGLFAIFNAIIHFLIAKFIQKKNLADKNLKNIIIGLVLIFITIAIPVQLDGNWVTLLWTSEALLLFWLGRVKKISVFEILSYPLIILATISLFHDWDSHLPKNFTPIFNANFLTNLLFTVALGGIYYIKKHHNTQLVGKEKLLKVFSLFIPITLIFTSYMLFQIQISAYFKINKYEHINYAIFYFKQIWILNYSLLFFGILAFINTKKFKNRILGIVNIGILIFCQLIFALSKNSDLNRLEFLYLNQVDADIFNRGISLITIRYISYIFIIFSVVSIYQYVGKQFIKYNLKKYFEILLSIVILYLLSIELISLLNRFGTESYKLELTILWGIFALTTIGVGIFKKKKHLRIASIILFGITLIKLFIYDISHLNTISKTIVFVTLGILLLIISFLYNKFKHIISDEN